MKVMIDRPDAFMELTGDAENRYTEYAKMLRRGAATGVEWDAVKKRLVLVYATPPPTV